MYLLLLCLAAAAGAGCIVYTVLVPRGSRRPHKLDEAINDIGWTPLMLAAQQGDEEIIALLAAAGSNVAQQARAGTAELASCTALVVSFFWFCLLFYFVECF